MKDVSKKIFFWLLLVLSLVISLNNVMSLIIPMGLLVYRFRDALSEYLEKYSLRSAFIGSGLLFGILTEVFAIFSNIHKPMRERALLSPYPHVDIILGIFWYGLFTVIWYFLFKKYHYSKKEIFLLSGLYGLIFEQKGVFLLRLFSSGFLLSLFVMLVYALFPMLAYMLTESRFLHRKRASFIVRYGYALILLTLHVIVWYLFGFIYYPILQSLGYLGYLQ